MKVININGIARYFEFHQVMYYKVATANVTFNIENLREQLVYMISKWNSGVIRIRLYTWGDKKYRI